MDGNPVTQWFAFTNHLLWNPPARGMQGFLLKYPPFLPAPYRAIIGATPSCIRRRADAGNHRWKANTVSDHAGRGRAVDGCFYQTSESR
jgi:hypothetical protein